MWLENILLIRCILSFVIISIMIQRRRYNISGDILYQIRQDFIKRQRYQPTVVRRIFNAQNAKHD